MLIVVLGVFLLSGMSTLIYQVVWMRQLTQVFGSTVYAVSTVVTVFMAGLAIGSLYAGRHVDRLALSEGALKGDLLKRYAWIEALIGLYCLLTPWLFSNLDIIYVFVYSLSEVNYTLFSLLRLLLSFFILVIPTALMGATLPFISRIIIYQEGALGRHVGLLYGLNTLGAVCGVLLAAFWLIPSLGMQATLFSAVAINGLIALLCYVAASRMTAAVAERPPSGGKGRANKGPQVPGFRYFFSRWPLVSWVFALSGLAALAYEVIWFRILAMIIGNSVYAFSIMLAVYLLGIALGSYLLSRWVDRIKDRLRWLALIQLGIGLSVILLTPLFGKMPLLFMGLVEGLGSQFWQVQLINTIIAASVLAVPTLLLGATFPLVVRIMVPGLAQLGRTIGSLYALNTLGGVVGSLLAGFILIPYLGMQDSSNLVAMLNILLGCCLLFGMQGRNQRQGLTLKMMALTAVFFAAFVVAAVPPWVKVLMTSGVYFNVVNYRHLYPQGQLLSSLEKERNLVYYKEGLTGTVSVNKIGDHLDLAINGKVTAAGPEDVFFNTLLGAVPLLLHENPQDALLVGLASGVSLDAMLQFSLHAVDVVDISPEVVEANALFSQYNHHALADARVRMIIDDGRSHLSYTPKQYDVIISMPPLPLSSGSANLFTLEYYQAMVGRLRDNGIVALWFPTYGIGIEELKIILRSFKQAFPYAAVWQYDVENIILTGSLQPLVVDVRRLAAELALPRVNRLLGDYGLASVEAVIGGLVLDNADVIDFTGAGDINSDNYPLLEFSVPRQVFKATAIDNYNQLVGFRPRLRKAVVLRDDDTGLDLFFMGLRSRLPVAWSLRFAGYSIRNRALVTRAVGAKPVLNKGVMPIAEWYNAETRQWLQLRTLRAESVERLKDLQRRPYDQGGGEWFSSGLAAIEGQRLDWVVMRRDGRLHMTLTWLCPMMDRLYIVEVPDVSDQLQPLKTLVSEISRAFTCQPGIKPAQPS